MTSQNHSKLMWHEARNQEKHIQKMLVDYRKRAERRKEYYEQIKLDPTQFLQVHGRSTKIHVDPSLYMAAEAPGTMLPWHGEKECMIDRFDGRAHLEEITPYVVNEEDDKKMSDEWDERQINYERYRILVQNDFLEITEEKFLQQIRLEELYGPAGNKSIEEEKKALASKKAAIGFSYDNEGDMDGSNVPNIPPNTTKKEEDKDDSGDESDSDIDLDMTVDVMQLSNVQQQQLNSAGTNYGMNTADFMSLISRDLQEAEELRQAKQHQDEKAMLSGRKSRKERRALKKKTVDKRQSPPSYAARSSPSYEPFRSAHSSSPSPPPPQEPGKIKFITSFGGDDSDHENGSDRDSIAQTSKQNTDNRHRRTDKTTDRKRNRWDQVSSGSDRRDRDRRNYDVDRRRNRSRDRDLQSRDRDRRSRDRDRRRYRNDDRGGSRHQRSRSPSKGSSYSRYRNSRSPRHTRSRSKSREKFGVRGKTSSSPSVKASVSPMLPLRKSLSPPSLAPPPARRYYGRRGGDSDSDDEDSETEKGTSSNQSSVGVNNEISSVGQPSSKVVPPSVARKEKLRKKMQLLLKRQYKADKAQEKERIEKQEQERMDREEELREMAIRMRRRERERRHKERSSSSRSSSRSNSSSPVRKRRSSPYTSDEEDKRTEHRRTSRRSKSPSRRPGLLPSPNMPPRLMDSRIDLSQPPPPLPDYNYRGWSGGNGEGRPPLCPTPPGEERSSCRGGRMVHSHPPPLMPEKEMDRVLYGGRDRERDHRDRRGERRDDYRGRHEGNGDRSSSSRKKLVDY